MGFIEELRNRKFAFSQPETETEVEPETSGPTFTEGQWATLLEVLQLEDNASLDDLVAAVTALAEATEEQIKQTLAEQQDIAASQNTQQNIVIDAAVWKDMQRSLKTGLSTEAQQNRAEAEQVVDQAIRLSKATPTKREHWISAYLQDPEATTHALNKAQEIPRMEIGYGIDPSAGDTGTELPSGWVR